MIFSLTFARNMHNELVQHPSQISNHFHDSSKKLSVKCADQLWPPKSGSGWETQQTGNLHPLKDSWSHCQCFSPWETLLTLTAHKVFLLHQRDQYKFTQIDVSLFGFSFQQQHSRTRVSMTKAHRLTAWVYCVKSQKFKENIHCSLMDEIFAPVHFGHYPVWDLKCSITH